MFGSSSIPARLNDLIVPHYEEIDFEDQIMIDSIIEDTFDYTASQLVDITHNQAPWKSAYRRGWNNIISNHSIREYFQE